MPFEAQAQPPPPSVRHHHEWRTVDRVMLMKVDSSRFIPIASVERVVGAGSGRVAGSAAGSCTRRHQFSARQFRRWGQR